MSTALGAPGLEALRKERAARRAAEREARRVREHAAAVEAGAAVLQQRIAAAEAQAQRSRASADMWMTRAQTNGRTVQRFKEQAARYEALDHLAASKIQTNLKADRP